MIRSNAGAAASTAAMHHGHRRRRRQNKAASANCFATPASCSCIRGARLSRAFSVAKCRRSATPFPSPSCKRWFSSVILLFLRDIFSPLFCYKKNKIF
jgi:hypothetical protein